MSYTTKKLATRISQKYVDRTDGPAGPYCNPQKFNAVRRALRFQREATLRNMYHLQGRAFVAAVEKALSE